MNIQNIQSAPPYISKFINTNFTKLIEIYDNGIMVGAYCDIPTCRRAIKLLNDDPKIRNKIVMKMSSKVRMELENTLYWD